LYEDELWKATHSMFVQTAQRVKQEVYGEPPPFIVKTLIRWSLSDPKYQEGFLRYIHRAIEPSERPTPGVRFYLRGIRRDLVGR
jgi:hypothetical protein